MIDLMLPFPPSVNGYWRSVVMPGKNGKSSVRVLISAKGRKYRQDVAKAVVLQLGARKKRLDCRLSVQIKAQMPSRHKRDLDNLPKSVLDSLTHAGVWLDDEQIDVLEVVRCGVKPPGGIRVRIWEIEPLEKQAVFW